MPDSPALGAGGGAICQSVDQRGIHRPQSGACDIGAFELTPPQPALRIVQTVKDYVDISWPFAGRAWMLEGSVKLRPPAWVPIPIPDESTSLRLFAPGKAMFFRMRLP